MFKAKSARFLKSRSRFLMMFSCAALCLGAPASNAANLLHRWSFTGDGTDSVGGANATLIGTAQFDQSALELPGGGPFANYATVNLSNTLASSTSLSVEGWFTMTALQNWSKLWMFGQDVPADQPALSYINFTPRTGTAANTPKIDFDTATATELNTLGGSDPAPLLDQQEYHVVAIFDSANNTMSYYLDGVLADSAAMGGGDITQLRAGVFRIGTGFVFADPDFTGSINELRVYGGALGGLQVAVNAQSGPDAVNTNVALNSLTLNIGSRNVNIGDLQDTSVTYNTTAYGSITITNSTESAYTVEPAGILQVSANGRVSAVAPGSATVTAVRDGKTSSVTITVSDVPLALQHRYSFSDSDGAVAVDSVNSAWNGNIVNASIINNEVVLPGGTFSVDPGAAYVDLPNGIVSNLNSITIEAWLTDNNSPNWARIYDFGNSVDGEDSPGSGTGQSYMLLTPRSSNGEFLAEITRTGSSTPADQVTTWRNTALPISNKVHVAYALDAVSQVARLYVDGVQVGQSTNVAVRPKNLGVTVNNWIGRAQFNDATLNASIDEFRIWNRALSPAHLAASVALGPDTVLTDPTLQSLSVSVESTSMVGGTTQQASALANFPQTNGVPVTAGVSSWTSSDTNVLTVSSSGVITPVGAGTATVTAVLDGISATSPAISVAVVSPAITVQPAPATRYAGGIAAFSVTATGGQLTYQWKRNGAEIAGATNSVLLVSGLTQADQGANFTVGVTNSAGGVVSTPAQLTVLALPAGYQGTVLADGSVGYWRLNETVADTAADSSLNGNVGAYSGMVQPGATSLVSSQPQDSAANFATTSKVMVPYQALLNAPRFSVEFWAMPADTASSCAISTQNRSGSRAGYTVFHHNGGNGWAFLLGNDAGSTLFVQGATSVEPNQAYHVVATYDGVTARLYVNGVLDGSAPLELGPGYNPNTVAPFQIGARNSGDEFPFNGVLDEVAVYPVALSAEAIANHYAMAVYGPSTAPTFTSDLPATLDSYVGMSQTLRVQAVGSLPLTYVWRVNGSVLPDATGTSLTLANLQAADHGKNIQVTVGNAAGSVVSATTRLNVTEAPVPPAMSHRWTFNTDGADSAGSVTCLPIGGATISGGSLNLPGGGTRANCGLIHGITNTLNSTDTLTIEAWLTINTLVDWSKGWMFGSPDPDAVLRSYVDFTPRAGIDGNIPSMSISTTVTEEVNTRAGNNPPILAAGQEYHIVTVYDAGTDTMSMFINGALVDSVPMEGRTIRALNATEAYIGAAVFFGDADLNGKVNELRLYPSALTPLRIQANFQTGPDYMLGLGARMTISLTGNDVQVSWPSGILQSAPALDGPWVAVPSATSPYTTPATGTQQFFRLVTE